MAVKRWEPINIIAPAAASGTAILDCPTGPRRYHRVTVGVKLGNVGGATEAGMVAQISKIRIKLGSTPQREFTPQQLFNVNRTKGKSPTVAVSTATYGYLTFFFTEPQRKSVVEREATAWGTAGVERMTIEIDFASTATTPVVKGFAYFDDVTEPPNGIVKWKSETIQIAAIGDVPYKLDTTKGESYQAVHFIEATAGDIGAIKLEWDGLKIYQDDAETFVEMRNAEDFGTVTKYRSLNLDSNSISDALPGVKKTPTGAIQKVGTLMSTLTMVNAANVTCVREVIGSPD
jgi:hypothetical protein